MANISEHIADIIAGMNLTDAQIELLTRNLATVQQNALLALNDDLSKAKEGSRVTRGGFNLIAKAATGKELKYTRMAIGDAKRNGQIVELTDAEVTESTAMINERMTIPIADCKFTGGGTFTVKGVIQNQKVSEGFYVRELGLFALDPDTGEEILYAYRNTGIISGAIPASDGAFLLNLVLTLITVVDDAINVTAVVDGNLAFVTQTELADHIASDDPHPNLPKRGDDISTATHIWATDGDANIHRISLADLQRLVLGGDSNTIPKVERRLSQVEINLANLEMQLKTESDLGFKPNLTLVEDFGDLSYCDMYSCNVLAQIAGVNGFQIESDKNILNGHWYTLTDGIHAEYVRIKSVAKNAGNIVIILENNLVHTYNLENTILLRSTTSIQNQAAEGAGDLRGTTIKFNETWQGSGGNVASELPLETSQSKIANFALEGDGAFTAAGEFTLTA